MLSVVLVVVCTSVATLWRKTPDFTLKKTQVIKNPDIQTVFKKAKPNLKCTLPVLAHKNLGKYALFATNF